jgi:hypothetical protein
VTAADATARGDLAEALLPDAAYLAMAVRDRDPADIAQRLAGLTRHELEALAVVLAALVDPDRSLREALGWIDFDEHGRPLDKLPNPGPYVIRNTARDPERGTTGPDYAAAIRGLEGEPLPMRGIDHTLAVEIGMRRGMTREAIAQELRMELAAVDRSWERIKGRRRAAGQHVPDEPSETAEQGEPGQAVA